MVEMDVFYSGDLHCSLKHGPSGSTLVTDAPKDNQGRGEAFSPTDLVATALATCIVTTMAMAARKHGVELRGLRYEVTKEMTTEAPRRIARLATQIWMPIPETHPAAKPLAGGAHACPVHRALDASVDKPIVFHWAQSV